MEMVLGLGLCTGVAAQALVGSDLFAREQGRLLQMCLQVRVAQCALQGTDGARVPAHLLVRGAALRKALVQRAFGL